MEVERLWPLRDRSATALKWRRRAWLYRQVLVVLARLYVTGFRRKPTQGETRPVRYTDSHLIVLAADVDEVKRTKHIDSDAAALRCLMDDGYFVRSMKFDAAKKLLARARTGK